MPPRSPSLSRTKLVRDVKSLWDRTKNYAGLKDALTLLNLSGFSELEEQFLATDAFLKPWSAFRDSVLLLHPDAMSQPTKVAKNQGDEGISRTDLLWFYTQFDEGVLRYDPRSDPSKREYTEDSSVWCVIDKSNWNLESYEKHLFAWMLQVFKVGKKRNPQGFHYFELRNVCTAWEAVLLPIVNAVRSSYSAKGKQHYGRLAVFIEALCPSGLAFPKGNVHIPASLLSPSPYRVISKPGETGDDMPTSQRRKASIGALTKEDYDEADKELRVVYPQYGGLVERPKYKVKMDEWLGEQLVRAERRKAAEALENTSHPRPAELFGRRDGNDNMSPIRNNKRQEQGGGESQIKRYSNSVRRSLSRSFPMISPPKEEAKEGPRNALYELRNLAEGSPPRTRVVLPSEIRRAEKLEAEKREAERREIEQREFEEGEAEGREIERHESTMSLESNHTTIVTPWPHQETNRSPSDQSTYSYIRHSNPFDLSDGLAALGMSYGDNQTVYSPMDQLSAVPKPLHREGQSKKEITSLSSIQEKNPLTDARAPSYEGNDWEGEISLTKLDTVRKNSTRSPEHIRSAYPHTRLPVPINPTPYAGNLRIASRHGNAPPSAFGSPGEPLPMPVPWPGAPLPPLPPKSPERMKSSKGYFNNSGPQQAKRNESERSVPRIVSKKNIRAALGGYSRDSSAEDLTLPPSIPMIQGPARAVSPGGTRLQTFNTNLFPRKEERKGTPVGAWVGTEKTRPTGPSYEMDVLGGEKYGES
ncbi:Casc1 N domain containing protein [Pyrenophora teres f. maculata]|nr:Casc1 N domain containing protein [Pyrenophora teres f. maculata]